MNLPSNTMREEWKNGWLLVLTSAMGFSIITYFIPAIGFVMKSLQADFGWSRGEISSVVAIKSTVLIFASPFLGWAVDRYGPRRLALPGVIAFCITFAAIGLSGPNLASWYFAWTCYSIAALFVSSTVWTAAVAGRFEKSRGLALGATIAGDGIGLAIVPPIAIWALANYDWRAVFFILAAAAFAFAFPLSYLFFYSKNDQLGRRGKASQEQLAGLHHREVLRNSRFWRLALAFFVGGGAISAVRLHLFPMMTDLGISSSRAAAYFMLLGPMTIAGRLLCGFFMDRFPVYVVGSIVFAIPVVNSFLIPYIGTTHSVALLVVIIVGLSSGAEVDTISILCSRYFGLRSYGRNYAPLAALYSLGSGLAGALGGFLFDILGNYELMIIIVGFALALASALIFSLGRPPDLESDSKLERFPIILDHNHMS